VIVPNASAQAPAKNICTGWIEMIEAIAQKKERS